MALFLALRRVDKRNFLLIFLISAVAGTLVEPMSSYIREDVFHSYSWDYRHLPFNFEGRICLGMTVGWGAPGVAWVLFLCPGLEKILALLPQAFVGRLPDVFFPDARMHFIFPRIKFL